MSNELLKRIFSSIVLIPIIFFSIIKGEFYFNILLIVLISFVIYEWDKLVNQKIIKTTGFGFIFFVFILSFFLRNNYNPEIFLFLILICVSTDLGGYIFGKILKGPKLSKVSPNKTYSGMTGSYILSLLSGYIFLKLKIFEKTNEFLFELNNLEFVILIVIISSISQVGDLIISYFKRLAKVKNTGNLLPGHGGILDRIDGLIFAVPVFYLLILILKV